MGRGRRPLPLPATREKSVTSQAITSPVMPNRLATLSGDDDCPPPLPNPSRPKNIRESCAPAEVIARTAKCLFRAYVFAGIGLRYGGKKEPA